jgi:hypothetical protein
MYVSLRNGAVLSCSRLGPSVLQERASHPPGHRRVDEHIKEMPAALLVRGGEVVQPPITGRKHPPSGTPASTRHSSGATLRLVQHSSFGGSTPDNWPQSSTFGNTGVDQTFSSGATLRLVQHSSFGGSTSPSRTIRWLGPHFLDVLVVQPGQEGETPHACSTGIRNRPVGILLGQRRARRRGLQVPSPPVQACSGRSGRTETYGNT